LFIISADVVDGAKSAIFGQTLGQCAIDRISLILDFLAQPESKPLCFLQRKHNLFVTDYK